MLKENHNQNSKQLFQKILIFIDTVLVNASNASPEETGKVLVSGMLNVRDAIFSELIRDKQLQNINDIVTQHQEDNDKKNEKENLKDLNQETESVKDQQA
jgi:hypothetical protein